MPKEYLITDDERRRADEFGGPRTAVRVGWERDGWVQIGTVLKALLDGNPRPVDPDSSDVGPAPAVFADEGQFVDLDRKTLNNLIRTLRRARDQAYGRDE